MVEHSKDDQLEYYNAECIYSYRVHCSPIEKIEYYEHIELSHWADGADFGWVNSPSQQAYFLVTQKNCEAERIISLSPMIH